MSRLSIKRWFLRPSRSRFSSWMKCILFLLLIYVLNLIAEAQYYIWSVRSFENEYDLAMTKIDLAKIDVEHPENILGPEKYILPNRFLIKNEDLCNGEQSQPHLIILVKSAIEYVQARQAIRMTWAKKEVLERNSVQVAFVLGLSERNVTIEKESERYGDIIQIDKIDNYYHNSYKMVMMLRWINDYCTSKSALSSLNDLRKYVLFIDDDCYLNLESLLKYLNEIDHRTDLTAYQRRTFLTGYLYKESRPRRFLYDRWYISITDYPYDRYPPFILGSCLLMSRANVRLFYLASKYIPLFRFDDVYMGILAYSMSIEIVPNNQLFSSYDSVEIFSNNQTGFFKQWNRLFNDWNKFHPGMKAISIHKCRGEDLIKAWNQIHQTILTLPVLP